MIKSRWFIVAGVALVAAGLGVRYAGDPLLIRYPLNIDQTMHYNGTATVSVDPATLKPLAKPISMPLSIARRVNVVSGGFSSAVVDETIGITFGGSTRTESYRYVMDRRTMQLQNTAKSYAMGRPADVMNPNGSYRINMSMSPSASGTYRVFAPETGTYAVATPAGSAHVDPVTGARVYTYNTSLDHQVSPYYATFLNSTGMPSQLNPAQAAALLEAKGASVSALLTAVGPHLTATQLATLTSALARPVPLTYSYFQRGQVSVEPTTGAVLEASSSAEGVSVTPDLTGPIATLTPILAPYRSVPAVAAFGSAVTALSTPQTVLNMAYTESPASARAAASTARHQASNMNLIRWRVPSGLVLLGMVVLALGAGRTWFSRRGATAPIHHMPVFRHHQLPKAAGE